MSIRLRLTLWHAAVFFASLAGFALVVWIGTRQVIRRDIDTWLVRQADGLCEFLRKETHGTGQAAVVEETREFSTGLPAGSGVQLFDPQTNVIYALPKLSLSGLSEQPSTLISGAQPVRAVLRTVTIADETFQVALWRSMDESETALKDLRDVLLLMVPAFLVISAAGGWFLSRRAFRPVDEITDAARQISLQNLSMTLPVPPHADELQRLTNAWNEMLRRLDASTRQLRQFTADASHELRTPVTVIRTTAELALRQERPPDQYRSALQAIRDDSQDLSSVIENLLELARADSGPVLSLQPVDFRAVVSDITSQVESMAGQLDVQFTLPPTPVFVMGDRAALRRLVMLLIDNAIKFTPVPGRVSIRVHAGAHEAIFEVEDSGIGISSEDLLRVFDRFYQVDHSRSGGGVGLGLSIGRWIVEEHNGRIEARSDLHHGSLFRVMLPTAGPPS